MTQAERRLERRTGELKKAVALEVQTSLSTFKKSAAARMIPFWAHDVGKCAAPTVAALAREIGLDRPHLSMVLNMQRPGGGLDGVRRKLEAHLELSIGGMTDVLSVMEAL